MPQSHIEMPVLWKTALKFGTMYKDNRSYQSCAGSNNSHSVGSSSLLCMGVSWFRGRGWSLGLRMAIKVVVTGKPDDETLPEVYYLACWSHLCHLRGAQCYLRQWKPPESLTPLSAQATLHLPHLLLARLSIHPSTPARLLLPGGCYVASFDNVEQNCRHFCAQNNFLACWKAADLKHRLMKTEFGGEVSQACVVRDVKDRS